MNWRRESVAPKPAPRPRAWAPELAGILGQLPGLTARDLPAAPFFLHAEALITGPVAWLDALRRDVAEGPAGTRAREGVLARDLLALERLLLGRAPCATDQGPGGTTRCRLERGHAGAHRDREIEWSHG